MKLSRRIPALLTTVCLLFAMNTWTAGAVSSNQDAGAGANTEPAAESSGGERTNCALSSYGGEIYLSEDTIPPSGSTAASLDSLNDGIVGGNAWNNWSAGGENGTTPYPEYATVGVTFYQSYTVDEVRLYLFDQTSLIPGTYQEVGVYAPDEIIIEYWDNSTESFVPVTGLTAGEIQGNVDADAENIITFDPVETTKLQARLKSASAIGTQSGVRRAVGLSEFMVMTSDTVETIEGPVVETPPPAETVSGVDAGDVAQSLNWTYDQEQSAPGTGPWKFLYDKPDQAPLPTAADQNFDFSALSGENWESVIVPSGLVIQGFDIKNNKEYYYQRQIKIPASFDSGKHNVMIRFDGVYSNARVWIDEHYVRTHKGGFTTWGADITDYVTAGGTFTLTVGMADIDGSTLGTWNQSGTNLSDPSGASYYANHNIGGITRDVTLEMQPKDYIAAVYTNTAFADNAFETQNYTEATLELQARLNVDSTDKAVKLDFKLYDPEDNLVKTTTDAIDFTTSTKGFTNTKTFSIPVNSPYLWDAEHPYLYTLESIVSVDGAVVETTSQRIGFREILYGGKNGSEPNKVYINGKEIKLRGVCRHDLSYKTGRSTSREEDYTEIEQYKQCNVNFIRTSHYPVSKHLLDACDELGIYVEEENASCWGPKNTAGEAEDYMTGLKEQVGRDRNRASVLVWSLGNESGWAPMYKQGYDYVKEEDPTRAVVFSYPNTINDGTQMDLFSIHYANWNDTLGRSDMPVLHDEYAPSAVHHYVDLQRDLNVRNFWGESIYKFWNNAFEADGCLGGSIWAAGDEVFYIPDGTTKRPGAQGDYEGVTAGDGIWGVVRDSYQRLKPEAFLLQKGYSPIRLDEDVFRFNGDVLAIPAQNWFNHTNFNELTLKYSVDGGPEQVASLPNLAPHASGDVLLNIGDANAKQVHVKFISTFNGKDMVVDEFNIDTVVTTYEFIAPSGEAPQVADSQDKITISGQNEDNSAFSVVFNKATGLIENASLGGETLITGGPYFHATYVDYGKWNPDSVDGITAAIVDNMAVVTLKGAYDNGQGVTFTIRISKNGIITTDYELTTDPALGRYVKEVGISYDIPSENMESVSWVRDGYHNFYPADARYPEGHIGREEGTALKVRADYETKPDEYGVMPSWPWELDMKDYSLYYTDDPNDGIVTNDFKSLRENIWYYDVNYTGTDNRIRVESDTSDSARVEVTPAYELVDDRDARIQYSGNWTALDNDAIGDSSDSTATTSYNGTEKVASTAGASCELTFNGTGVSVVSSRNRDLGYMRVTVDNGTPEIIRLGGNIGFSKRRFVYSVNGLEGGQHTIKVEQYSGKITFDGFAVVESVTPAQKSKLIIDQDYYYPNLNWGSYPGEPVSITEGTAGSATIRLTAGNSENKVETPFTYVDATDITGIQSMMFSGGSMNLNATVLPANATNKSVTYTVKDAGATEASITGKTLSAPKAGTVVVTAAVQNLAGVFEKDFTIEVRRNLALSSAGSAMYTGPDTETQPGHTVDVLNNGAIGTSSGYWTDFDWNKYSNGSYDKDATIGVTFDAPYQVDALELFILHDDGGCFAPEMVTVQYWDETLNAFVDVPNQSKTSGFSGNTAGSVGNIITFDPVTTTKLQAVMKHVNNDYGRAVALTEFAVLEDE